MITKITKPMKSEERFSKSKRLYQGERKYLKRSSSIWMLKLLYWRVIET